MRIVIEGLPGAGKTTLATRLCEQNGWPLVPEWAGFREDQWVGFEFHRPFYFANDEMKEHMAQALREPVVVLDRHYPSTLAFGYGLDAEGLTNPKTDESYEGNLSWYTTAQEDGRLRVPDRVVVLDVSPALSLERQPRARRFDAVWGDPQRLEAMRHFYRDVYPDLEPGVDLHIIDATRSLGDVYADLRARCANNDEGRRSHG